MRLPRPVAVRVVLSLSILAVAVSLATMYGESNPVRLAANIPPGIYAAILVLLLINGLTAASRFSFIASQVGSACRFRDAVAIVSASNIAGALFFQLAGQLAARGALMARSQSGSFANAVVITAYERVSAAAVSAIGATIGAYIVFGRLYFDWNAGASLVKLVSVGVLALASGIALSGSAEHLMPKLDARTLKLWAGALIFSALVQLPMMIAYMLAAHTLAPETAVLPLLGATLVVMFAASIPISFAGWGIRELSAVFALGAIGVNPAQAVLTALLIGFGSMISAGMCASITLSAVLTDSRRPRVTVDRVDYAAWLSLAVPVAAAIAVPFQVYLPVSGSIVNANLADPFALIGAALFAIRCVSQRSVPIWRYEFFNAAVIVATTAIVVSLLVGIADFGVTTWAVVNRFAGWFVLLCYVATGALAVVEHGKRGLYLLAMAFVGSMLAIAGTELMLIAIGKVITLTDSVVVLPAIVGFAQNRNAFAFQIIMALCISVTLPEQRKKSVLIAGVLAAALVFTSSRAGIGTGAMVIIGAAALGMVSRPRLFVVGAVVATAAAIAIIGLYSDIGLSIFSSASSDIERIKTINGGLGLFEKRPILGSGLGAYRNEGVLAANGEPLVIHSIYVWLLAETGLFGFISFVVPAAAIMWKELSRAHSDRTAAAVVLCFAAMAVMGVPSDMLYQRTFWILSGALLMVPLAASIDARGRYAG